jgi:predicted O-methyltransferase YrrM
MRVAVVGTSVGSAWIVSSLDPAVPFFAAGLDGTVKELFRDDPNVHVLPGDWRETLAREAPFDLLFLDAAGVVGEEVLGLLAPRGLVVSRERLDHPDLAATEVPVSAREALILAVRSR